MTCTMQMAKHKDFYQQDVISIYGECLCWLVLDVLASTSICNRPGRWHGILVSSLMFKTSFHHPSHPSFALLPLCNLAMALIG